jgi:GH35 family endo-1,4-beta-xylanase
MKRKLLLLAIIFVSIVFVEASNTPPSSVITYPHSNAYYQKGSDVTFNVYSTDKGGSFAAGTVTKVEFFVDDTKVHETSSHLNNTYTFVLQDVKEGRYRLTARATDNLGATFTSAGVILYVGTKDAIRRGMSATKGKYVGNIIGGVGIRTDYMQYWNGVTAENAHKWGSVEGTKDVMIWTTGDNIYNYAKNNHLMFRYHAIAWGSQYPGWLNTMYPADAANPPHPANLEGFVDAAILEAFETEFKAQIENYMAEMAARYPYMDQIDVLNENLYLNTYNNSEHAAGSPIFRAGMGGSGVTGYDWAIWLFERARHHFPNSKLVMNDFELESNANGIREMLDVVKVLRDRGLIDGFGTQAHTFNVDDMWNQTTTLKNRIDLMASSGVPVYVTELDLTGGGNPTTEANQLRAYQNIFPVFFEHPAVAGVTLWGYVEGQTWITGSGLINADGTKRSALVWLENYLSSRDDVGFPFAGIEPPVSPNMLVNGDFEIGTANWDMQFHDGAAASMTAVTDANMQGEQALKICPSSAGTSNWHIQVRQNAPIVAGQEYELSFYAKADADRTMGIAFQQEGGSFATRYQQAQNLTTNKHKFSYVFTPTITDATTKLKFYIGNNNSCVYIDDVVFRKVSTTSVEQVSKNESFFNVYPNPVSNILNINRNSDNNMPILFKIINGAGSIVSSGFVNGTSIDMSDLPAGFYLLQLKSDDVVDIKKIMKK